MKVLLHKIKCTECRDALIGCEDSLYDADNALIMVKTKGNLKCPSKDVAKICTKAEISIKLAIAESQGSQLHKKFTEDFLTKATLTQLRDFDIFRCLRKHDLDQEFLETHSVRLLEAVVRKYMKIRLFYLGKNTNNVSDSTRHLWRKLIQQKGY